MSAKIAVLMDPIENIKVAKDTSLAMMLAAQKRNWSLYYLRRQDLFMRDGKPATRAQSVRVHDDSSHWYDAEPTEDYFLE